MVRLNADRLETSTVSHGRLFHTLTTRSSKNVDLEVQLHWRFSILYGCPRVTLASLKSKKKIRRAKANMTKYNFISPD